MKRSLVIAAAVVLLVAMAAVAQPVPHRAGPVAEAGGNGPALAKFLQLTPDQVTAWKQIHTDTAATVKPLAESARSLRQQLRAALEATAPDATAVGKLAIQQHGIEEQIRSAHQAAEAKLAAVLTPDQKLKFDAWQAAQKFARRGPGPRGGR